MVDRRSGDIRSMLGEVLVALIPQDQGVAQTTNGETAPMNSYAPNR
jgi:hypothetical protein